MVRAGEMRSLVKAFIVARYGPEQKLRFDGAADHSCAEQPHQENGESSWCGPFSLVHEGERGACAR